MWKDCASWQKKRNVELKLEGHISQVYQGDEFWLIQALENIIKNAIEHTKEYTQVSICSELESSCIKIRIEDEGNGIPQEELVFLFERFCRGTSGKTGYGIGLNMAKDIIQCHHGTVTAGNRDKGGAWFLISLPILNGTKTYEHTNEG